MLNLHAVLTAVALVTTQGAMAGSVWWVDDDAPLDPGPGTSSSSDPSEDGSFDHPFDSVQEAIAASQDGDDVLVAPGSYLGVINLLGRAILLKSANGAESTILDGQGQGTTVTCNSDEGETTVIDGFTITGGTGTLLGTPNGGAWGGGMLINGAGPIVRNCIFQGNTARMGGGLTNFAFASSTIENCTFQNNVVNGLPNGYGAGIANDLSEVTVSGCTFLNNNVYGVYDGYGAGIWVRDSIATISGCTFDSNNCYGGSIRGRGGGVELMGGSFVTISGCTFADNFAATEGGAVASEGSIHQMSIGDTSFCGNAPDDVWGPYNDLGGNSLFDNCCPEDLDGSGDVGFGDLTQILIHWGPCPIDCPWDLDSSGSVGFGDLTLLLVGWDACS